MSDYPSVPSRFEAMAAAFPDRSAIETTRETIRYAALNAAANRLARVLLARCGSAPQPVALLFEPDGAFFTALLAVLKAGHFYVPLDPAQPQPRTQAIVADARPALLLTDSAHAPAAAKLVGAAGYLDVAGAGDGFSAENLTHPVSADALLNIMYTSGSTGRPKGVLQRHANIVHNVELSVAAFGLTERDRISQLMSPSFGGSVSDTLGALLTGAALLPYDLKRQGIELLPKWLHEAQISVYHSVPTVFRHLLNHTAPDTVYRHVRVVKLGGEPVTRRDVVRFKRHFAPGTILRNSLGSTETYMATWLLLDHDSTVDSPTVPVGRATAGSSVHVWDAARQPVAAGAEGELVVQSHHLSPGYWRDAAATDAVFINAPDGTRYYLTGDLGRQLPDGSFVHLGRKDHQVKIQGSRVEVAEVELALLEIGGVREAVVVAPERRPGERVLVAYVVPEGDGPVDSAEIRRSLAARLPLFMVPAVIIPLAALPLLPFGKINRRALPAPRWDALATPYAAPQTPLQAQIAAVWAEVLHVPPVGLHDDFFQLGGDSLRATQMMARLQSELNLPVTLDLIFAAPTVAQLAARLMQAQIDAMAHAEADALLSAIEGLDDDAIAAMLADDG